MTEQFSTLGRAHLLRTLGYDDK